MLIHRTRMSIDTVRWLGLWLVGFAFAAATADAAPITYVFSGTLSQPFDGSTQFSGTFTYNTNLPQYPGIQASTGSSYYSGLSSGSNSPSVTLNFAIGNLSSTSFGSVVNDQVVVSHTQSTDAFSIYEQFNFTGGQNIGAEFSLVNNNLVQPSPFSSQNPPTTLNLASFSLGGILTVWGTTAGGQPLDVMATVTSLEPLGFTAAPEPASFAVFAILGLGYLGMSRAGRIRGNKPKPQ